MSKLPDFVTSGVLAVIGFVALIGGGGVAKGLSLLSSILQEQREMRAEISDTRQELPVEVRDNRDAIDDLREGVNEGFSREDEQVDDVEQETTGRIDSANE